MNFSQVSILFICRCFDWTSPPAPSPPAGQNPISSCTSISLEPGAISGPNVEFYFSIEKIAGNAACAGLEILQVVFTMLTTTNGQTDSAIVDGEWEGANVATDFTSGKCLSASTSPSISPKTGQRFSINSCMESGTQDKKLFWYYNLIKNDGDVLCAKWKFPPSTAATSSEVQAGYQIHYSDGSSYFLLMEMNPKIYKVVKRGNSFDVSEVQLPALQLTSAAPTQTCLLTPQPRETSMCDCVTPRRDANSNPQIPTDPSKPIPDISSNAALAPCYQFEMRACSTCLTNDNLGAIFVQKNCPGKPGLTTADISVIAVNELGYPYGKLAVNKNIRCCLTTAEVPTFKTVVNAMYPVPYTCSNLYMPSRTLYGTKIPEWLSISANMAVDVGPPVLEPVLQVAIVDQIKTPSTPHPTEIQFIVEFSVLESATSAPQIFRMRTDHYKLAFDASNSKVDFASSTIIPTPIELHADYLDEASSSPNPTCPGSPPPAPPAQPPTGFFCRCFQWEMPTKPPPAPLPLVEKCAKIVFQEKTAALPLLDFFFSVEKLDAPECTNLEIAQTVATMLTRGSSGTDVSAEWFGGDVTTDFIQEKCLTAQLTPNQTPKVPLRYSVSSCTAQQDKKLFWYYSSLKDAGDIICGKWKYGPPGNQLITEIQVGYQIFIKNGNTEYIHEQMHPIIYEVERLPGATYGINIIATEINDRIVLQPSPFPSQACLNTPERRKTNMCDCVTPRRGYGPAIPQNPNVDIPDISSDPVLKNCFSFEMTSCPDSLTDEELGAVFIQKDCPGKAELLTVDVSVLAINEIGYPYGQFTVNKYTRACFTPGDIVTYKPILHYMYPTPYACDLFEPSRSLYGTKIPEWLSIGADLTTDSVTSNPPSVGTVLQIALKDQVKSASAHPSELQFIAEFAVIEAAGAPPKQFRIKTSHYTLAFGANGKVDFASSTTIPTDIDLHGDYTDELITGQPACTGNPPPSTPPPPSDPNWLLCRCTEWEAISTPQDTIKDCYRIVFQNQPANSLEFYVSLEKTGNSPACAALEIKELLFVMLTRDDNGIIGTKAVGVWQKVDAATGYIVGKCLDANGNPAGISIKLPGKFNSQSCNNMGPHDKGLYYFYKGLSDPGDIICGHWEFAGATAKTEIQLGYKIFYQDAAGSKFTYGIRHPLIYEISPAAAGGGQVVEIVSQRVNDRVELYFHQKPPSSENNCVVTPFIPTSDVCHCSSDGRHQGFPEDPISTPVTPISKANPPIPLECFDFKMVPCSEDGKEYNTIGAILIIHAEKEKPACTADIIVEDISFQALHEEGIPFGEISQHKFMRSCILPNEMINHNVKNFDFLNPVGSICDGRVDENGDPFTPTHFKYPVTPTWVAVNAQASLKTMERSLAIQIYFKRVKDATAKKIQMVAEMVIKSSSGTRELISVKSLIYQIDYDANGFYDPSKLVPAPSSNPPLDIEPNPEFYESDKSQAKCIGAKIPNPEGGALPTQHCGCFEYTDTAGLATRLEHTDALYKDKFQKCVQFEAIGKVTAARPNENTKFLMTIYTDSSAPECQGYDIVGFVVTPLKQMYGKPPSQSGWKNPNSQYGFPHGEFERSTYAPAPVITFGQDCPVPASYAAAGGRLRRLPINYETGCLKRDYFGKMIYYYYDLMNQPDKGDGFCIVWTFPEETIGPKERFEFQMVAEVFIDDRSVNPGSKYFALKRFPVYEYLPDPPTSFPGEVFPIANPNDDEQKCETDICIQ